MKTFSIIGIDPFHYEDIKFNTYLNWITKNTKSAQEYQLSLIDKSLQKNFMSRLASLEIRFLAHLQMFKKEQSKQQKLSLYLDYMKEFDFYFPGALRPKVSRETEQILNPN